MKTVTDSIKVDGNIYEANQMTFDNYTIEEDNIKEDGKYYYLTKLAAECTAKRMVPDYISEKIN